MTRKKYRRLGLACLGAVLALTAGAAGLAVLGRLDPAPMPPVSAWGTRILADDGSLLALAPAPGGVWRFDTSADDVSPFLRQLLETVEDRRFGTEPGVDPRAVLRAGLQWAAAGHVVSGGSTLTMQVAKLLDPRPRRLSAKVLETARAFDLWRRMRPDRIMGLWLSLAPFGGNLVGVEAASYAYFGKPPGALDAAEAALLVALPRRPEALRPDRHPEAAKRLRDRILVLAEQRGLLTAAEATVAQAEPVPTHRFPMPRALPQLLASLHHPPVLRTSIDPVIQAAVDQAAQAALTDLPPRVALVVMVGDLKSRKLSALWLGDWIDKARAGRTDLTRALRSPGSALKPFLYALAFADGLAQPNSLLADTPDRFGSYGPEDFTGRFAGRVTAAEALRRSLNLPAVGLLARYGALRFSAALTAAGTPLALPRDAAPSLPIILGGAGLSMRQLMALYAGLATDGRVQPLSLFDKPSPQNHRLLPPASAQTVADILTRPFPGEATARGIAWKTGTSWGDRDNWAFGFDRTHIIGVWVGRPDGTAMDSGAAADHALPILARLFSAVPAAPRVVVPETRMLSFAAAPSPDPLRLLFPPPGAVIDGLGPLDLKAMGGERPLSFLIDNAPIFSIGALRQTQWLPPGPGFYHVTVLDAAGAAVHAAIRVTEGD
ncbi:transglycosylase domain-containing protein [Acidisoma cellulosilytica]|uniref:peptidoglycan glycosyltransferase n=1 Tax=Acidisoma cellulosilyticum TaxID=2802395 RepID=A0A963Z2A4_9PROT|nr:transglycosylase domain-containing protein [Acidisoma cellulosilyticum]MCB8881214.1 transglycosylase domain-containing protein [Acidisoma cellulosilyticum]